MLPKARTTVQGSRQQAVGTLPKVLLTHSLTLFSQLFQSGILLHLWLRVFKKSSHEKFAISSKKIVETDNALLNALPNSFYSSVMLINFIKHFLSLVNIKGSTAQPHLKLALCLGRKIFVQERESNSRHVKLYAKLFSTFLPEGKGQRQALSSLQFETSIQVTQAWLFSWSLRFKVTLV